jgi:hypothetical protein
MMIAVSPLFRFSTSRDAYVLRMIGNRVGPVLIVDRRRKHPTPYQGVDRRGQQNLGMS